MTTKYIFITGGVVSSLGKGIVAASFGKLLKEQGYNVTIQKFDPYINMDSGTMSPYQHGETFVTKDGLETDLDLGHYERFMDIELNKYSNVTTGRIYSEVMAKERRGEYDGGTVQVIPHITNEIKENIKKQSEITKSEIVIIEIGGTIGDIESLPFIEAIRQMKNEIGSNNTLYVHVSLLPYLNAADELKTKPTQHSVRELRKYGIQPDLLVLRSEKELSEELKNKISMFTDVKQDSIIESIDVDNIYKIPLNMKKQKVDEIILKKFELEYTDNIKLQKWSEMINKIDYVKDEINIAVVGKYTDLKDAYISVKESLLASGYYFNTKVKIKMLNSEKINNNNIKEKLKDVNGIMVPGGFGNRGIEGKIEAIKYARENNIPFLGVCLGMQLATIEYARNVLKYEDANSLEFDENTKNPIITLLDNQKNIVNKGGTLRLGNYKAYLKDNTKTKEIYGEDEILERHRHRYEFNTNYKDEFEKAGMIFSGTSENNSLMEIIELDTNDFFIGVQYHPEFKSRPNRPEPVYREFIHSAINNSNKK